MVTARLTPVFGLVLLALGYLLGSLGSPPADGELAGFHGAAGPAQRSSSGPSPLLSVTRELASERRRSQELSDSLAAERAARKGCARRSVQVAATAAWPCGLQSTRLDQARWRRQWCAAAANVSATPAGAQDCSPPQPAPDYVVLTYLPEHDSDSQKVAEKGGVMAPHLLPWLDEALAFEAGGAVVDVGAHFGHLTTLYALARGASVVAVEARPRAAHALRLSAALNGWDAQLTVHEQPLGGADGAGRAASRCEAAEARLAPAAVAAPPSLEELLGGLPAPVALLRVGTRASEARLFGAAGAAEVLASALLQPRFVGLSLKPPSSREALEPLYRHGYVCAPFGSAGPPLRGPAWDWDLDRVQRYLREQEAHTDVRCVSPLVQKHLWRSGT